MYTNKSGQFDYLKKKVLLCCTGATPTILESLEMTVERAAFARLYLHVLFPNGEGDIARDQCVLFLLFLLWVFYNCIGEGYKSITYC